MKPFFFESTAVWFITESWSETDLNYAENQIAMDIMELDGISQDTPLNKYDTCSPIQHTIMLKKGSRVNLSLRTMVLEYTYMGA